MLVSQYNNETTNEVYTEESLKKVCFFLLLAMFFPRFSDSVKRFYQYQAMYDGFFVSFLASRGEKKNNHGHEQSLMAYIS